MNTWRRKRSPGRTLHPLWRGVGCLIVVLMPLLAWWFSGFGLEFVQSEAPEWLRAAPSGSNELLFIRIGIAAIIGLALYLLLTFSSSLLLSMVNSIDRFIERLAGGNSGEAE
ncbi:MAG: hypothetical protein KIS85_02685 [Anaerolineales bacterium]|nr:hypothetical protein [Anaerolineales bacterium]